MLLLGASIVGPLIIAAAVLALVGAGAVWLAGGQRRSARIRAGWQRQQVEAAQQPEAERDPLDELSTDELRLRAGSVLVAADNAVSSSEQELLFAQASYGEERIKPFQQDLEEATRHLRQSFSLQQQADQTPQDQQDEIRDLYKRIIHHCEQLDQTLTAHQEEFEGLRSLERDPTPALEQLQTRIDEFSRRRRTAEDALETMAQKYDDDALAQYRDNLTQSQRALESAEQEHRRAAEAVQAGDTAAAVVALHSGEQAAADVQRLVESMEQTEDRLAQARKNIEIGITQTEQDIAQAKALRTGTHREELAGPIAAAEQAVAQVRDVLQTQERIDPLRVLHSLEIAHRELDEPLNAIRDQQAKDRRAREVLDHELVSARNQVESAADYLRARRYGISATARTRMAEAQRCLAEAHERAEGEPARALDYAQQAGQLAAQAAQIAQREIAEGNLAHGGQVVIGGGHYGTGGGFGGMGYGYGYGRRPGGYGMGRAARTGMRMGRMAHRGRRF